MIIFGGEETMYYSNFSLFKFFDCAWSPVLHNFHNFEMIGT